MLSTLGKKSAIFSAAAALAAAPLLTAAPTAQADPAPEAKALLSCDLGGTASFSPGLSGNPLGDQTQMRVEGDATNCAPGSRAAEDVASATFAGDLSGTMSCTSLPRGVGGDVDITWQYKDGSTKTSKANFTLDMQGDLTNPSNPASGVFGGKTTDGEFADAAHKGEAKLDLASAAGGCLMGGLEEIDFNGTYELSQ